MLSNKSIRDDAEFNKRVAERKIRGMENLVQCKDRYDSGAFEDKYSLDEVLELKMSKNAKPKEYNGIDHSEYLPLVDEYISDKQIIKYMKDMLPDNVSIKNCRTLQDLANVLYQEKPLIELVVFQSKEDGANNVITNHGNLGRSDLGFMEGGVFSIPKFMLNRYAADYSDICSFMDGKFVIQDYERFGMDVLNDRSLYLNESGVYMIETIVPINGNIIAIPSVNNIAADIVEFVPGGYSMDKQEIQIVQKQLQGINIEAGFGICGDTKYIIEEI